MKKANMWTILNTNKKVLNEKRNMKKKEETNRRKILNQKKENRKKCIRRTKNL